MENIQRYKLYTAEELKERQEAKEKKQKREEFMTTGPNRLSTAETDINTVTASVDDITTLMADMIGVMLTGAALRIVERAIALQVKRGADVETTVRHYTKLSEEQMTELITKYTAEQAEELGTEEPEKDSEK